MAVRATGFSSTTSITTGGAWRFNKVNNDDTHFRYDLFHADGKSYCDWAPNNNGKDPNKYTMPDAIRSSYLSTSPYPYTNPTTLAVNNSLTDESLPAATLFTPAADGRKFMGKAITNIRQSADGTISFDFMMDSESGIITASAFDESDAWYTIDGRRLPGRPTARGLYIRRPALGGSGKKIVRIH